MLSAREILDVKPPRFPLSRVRASKTKVSKMATIPELVRWPDFDDQVAALVPSDDPKNLLAPHFIDDRVLEMTTEADTQHAFLGNMATPALRATKHCRFVSNARLSPTSTLRGDFLLLKETRNMIAGKCKLHSAGWADIDDIIESFPGIIRVKRAVRQLFTYMCVAEVKYGILTSYGATWFFQRVPNQTTTLQVSRKFEFDDEPSVASCIWFLLQQNSRTMPYNGTLIAYYSTDDTDNEEEDDDEDDDGTSDSNYHPSPKRQKKRKQKRTPSGSHLKDMSVAQLERMDNPKQNMSEKHWSGLWMPTMDENNPSQVTAKTPVHGMTFDTIAQVKEIEHMWQDMVKLQGTVIPRMIASGIYQDRPIIVWQDMDTTIKIADLNANEKGKVLGLVRQVHRECKLLCGLQGDRNVVRLADTGELALFHLWNCTVPAPSRESFLEGVESVQKLLFGSG